MSRALEALSIAEIALMGGPPPDWELATMDCRLA